MRTRRTTSSSDPVPPEERHQSVLLHEAIQVLAVEPHHSVVDGTVGGAGHTQEIANLLSEEGVLVGIDADAAALDRAKRALKGVRCAVRLLHGNFRHLPELLALAGAQKVDRALFDLGWSAYQLAPERGFSFRSEGPLDMTYAGGGSGLTAGTIVNEWNEESIADVIFGWGEERFARRIARAVVARREMAPITTTTELADIVRAATPSWYRYGRVHPATKTFQALRIAVNDELGALRELLSVLPQCLHREGRVAFITFHSLEDRIVKRAFAAWRSEGLGDSPTKKPIAPSREECTRNPRARSAKLRVFSFK